MITKEELAKFIHDKYEAISIKENWDTQNNCKVDFEILPNNNKKVMLQVAEDVIVFFECKGFKNDI